MTTINVRDFGAVGDGVTDDTEAFARAMAACLDDGGAFYIPPGTYKINAPISPNNAVYTFAGDSLSVPVCQDCGESKPDVEDTTCPYAAEIADKTVEIRVCRDCYRERRYAI